MLVASFDNVSKRYGAQVLLEGGSFQINRGQKIGLIGPNGAGKTTLLNVLIGQEAPSSGTVVVPRGVRLGYVRQVAEFEPGERVLDCVLRDHHELRQALRARETHLTQVDQAHLPEALQAYERAREAYDHNDGDHFPQRAQAMLDALGLAGKGEQPVASLSGGEKNVLSLSQALLAKPDLLILDEPGNHLDFLGIAWLEAFLNRFKGAVLIVSHNRYLLDRVVQGILHLEGGSVRYYDGNYSNSRLMHLRDVVSQQARYAADQKRLARLEYQVKRLQETAKALGDAASGQRYRAMKSRYEREKKSATDKPTLAQAGVKAAFTTAASRADIALELKGYSKRFGERVLFDEANLHIKAGERVALVGPNGSGKTSLLRDIVRHGCWEHPTLRLGPSVTLGYGSQTQEEFEQNRTVLKELLSAGGLDREEAIALLARFLFAWEDAQKWVCDLSGGERNRLQLAKLIAQQPNFLILDEPTNHLDIPTREAVEAALDDYEGTLLVVSHDRYFLDRLVQRVVEIKDGGFHAFEGNFSQFWQKRSPTPSRTSGRATQRRRQRERTRLPQSNPALVALEQRLAGFEREKLELESAIGSAFTQGDHQKGRRLTQRLAQLKAQLDDAYQAWVDLEG